jgi:hypothetical protein
MAADAMGDGAPSEAEMQQMLAQMREAPAEQILVEVVNALLQAVQVKLGRPDARLLLDVVAAIAESARGRAEEPLVTQVADAVARLRLAQVDAEGGSAASDRVGGPAAAAPGPAPQSATQPATAAGDGSSGGGSRLWVPGS